MKLSNLLIVLVLALAGFSCSMENDQINSDLEKLESSANGNAALTFKVNMNSAMTKATGSVASGSDVWATTDEAKINHCSIILLNSTNQVIGSFDGLKIAGDIVLNPAEEAKGIFLVKANATGLKVMIIANSSQTYKDCTNLAAITAKVQGSADLDNLVKIGTASVTDLSKQYTATQDALNDPNTVSVSLTQLAARIELAAFNVTSGSFSNTNKKDVKVSRVILYNGRTSSTTELDGTTSDVATNGKQLFLGQQVVYTVANGAQPLSSIPFGYTFPTKASDASSAINLYVEGYVGDKMFYKNYTIKHSNTETLVKSGYLYRLTVNMTVSSDEVTFDVTCNTKDWVYNKIEVNL